MNLDYMKNSAKDNYQGDDTKYNGKYQLISGKHIDPAL